MTSSDVRYDFEDTGMVGFLALPGGPGPFPGVLLCHEGPGLYGRAAHSVTNPEADSAGVAGIAYDRLTDERSWRAMLDLFTQVGMAPS